MTFRPRAKAKVPRSYVVRNSVSGTFIADCRLSDRWHAVFDFEGLAGGPGRAFDVSLKLAYDINERWSVTAGYRTVEGGVDIDDVYNFAWFQYAVASGVFRF